MFLKKVFISIIVCLLLMINNSAVYASNHVEVARKFLKETFSLLDNEKLTMVQKKQTIVDRYIKNINFSWNAKMAMGRPFKELSAEDQQVYIKEYSKFLAYIWLPKLNYDKSMGVKMKILDKSDVLNDTDEILTLIIDFADGTRYEVNLRTRITKDNQFQILNLTMEGIDIAASYRSQFTDYMEKHNNDPKSIIKYLKDQNVINQKKADFVVKL